VIGGRLAEQAYEQAWVHGAKYRRIGVPELEALNGAGVFYGGPSAEAPGLAGLAAYVVGGANSAGQAALHLARFARTVTLVVRAQSLGAGMSHYLSRQIEATRNIDVRLATEVVGGGDVGEGSIAIQLVHPLMAEPLRHVRTMS
jgi:thioredoxin reductase (NADPH)